MSPPVRQTLPAVRPKPTLAVFKFASCDGCQLSLLDCEDELLAIAGMIEIRYFLEASSHFEPGPYDVALVEGSITTPHDAQRIQDVRRQSGYLVTIGACATAGGVQALKNWADHEDFLRTVYARPEYISTLATSTPIAEHVAVDFELRGCPINRHQLVEVIAALVAGRQPRTPSHSVCLDCKRRGTVCIEVAQGIPCLGPVTQTGCGAICPAYDRGCYGCFGPAAQPNCESITRQYAATGTTGAQLIPLLRNFNAAAPEFRTAGDRVAAESSSGGGA
ncbi:NAD-reducing hydrogenase HoxS subunit delta [Maioricimonas rarisocia]|uniref:NAD-reducing hydrogenase HoxS subunit delta n=1 Tax=Maioricimonas rarisocia TaxID=2528026 RepID=A0A517Z6J4_9PLAN|nr:oxidoreductase [Maioricimonas rarisocia]QDU38112.1 NAD-reducing hydrogenase HoxS subunit delta [Maioricimonas rarisocia]